MAHLEVLTCCPEYNHQRLKSTINEMRYYSEGVHFQGYHRPFVSEMRYYDIRIRKEFMPQFVKDAGINTKMNTKAIKEGSTHKGMLLPLFEFARRLIWKFTPLKGVTATDKPKLYSTHEWHYSYLIGMAPDQPVESKMSGNKRECL